MAINYFADTNQTIGEWEIHQFAADWTSKPPQPAYALVPINVYFGMLTIWAWLAYPNNMKKRKDTMHACYASGAYDAWRHKEINRKEIPDDAARSAISTAKRKRLYEATHNRVKARARDAFEIVAPFIQFQESDQSQAQSGLSFYKMAESRATEDNANFYHRRLKGLLPVSHLALAYGRFGLPHNDIEVLHTLNYAEALRQRICKVPSKVIASTEIVQFRPQAMKPRTEVKFG